MNWHSKLGDEARTKQVTIEELVTHKISPNSINFAPSVIPHPLIALLKQWELEAQNATEEEIRQHEEIMQSIERNGVSFRG